MDNMNKNIGTQRKNSEMFYYMYSFYMQKQVQTLENNSKKKYWYPFNSRTRWHRLTFLFPVQLNALAVFQEIIIK